ncbi:putative aryl-alcohol dehydrogenase AAD6 [Colletotrichum orbiculare MAFF 240422]|uniref:Aryl-alcohol dehydrogenase AAD6 n=1 Tax=Colletotrichum orbiculare (strain 104-T / ATCC 96160 / CBS 514.97 / LARS 414 / MAFF 240422) TaxID=1213857 RepID=A0A484FFX7_COLOR|nr:putative aryl-alcohol dehydrogenase AAD6 [Colletotrichum orbiculare MAFF 240422]
MSSFLAPAPEPATELGRLRVLFPTAGIRVSPLALGAMSIGEAWADAMGAMDKPQSFKLIYAFFESGGNFIDTANGYQNGESESESESWIGEWMRERGNRDRVVIAKKYSSDYQAYVYSKGNTANLIRNHRRSLHLSVLASLAKLQTDFVDILYLY